MNQPLDPPELSAAESAFIQNLRALPDEALRNRVHTSLNELLFFFRHPKCEGMGVEGFPCGDPRSTCEECHQIWDMLDRVAERAKQP